MNSNPVRGPTPPEPPKGASDVMKSNKTASGRELKKVKEIDKVDDDEKARARKFRDMVDEPDHKDKKSGLGSPFDLFTEPTSQTTKNTPIPQLKTASSSSRSFVPADESQPSKSSSSLPKSKEFWSDVNAPEKNPSPVKDPVLEEKERSKKRVHPDFLSIEQILNQPQSTPQETISSHLGIPIQDPLTPIPHKQQDPKIHESVLDLPEDWMETPSVFPKTGQTPNPSFQKPREELPLASTAPWISKPTQESSKGAKEQKINPSISLLKTDSSLEKNQTPPTVKTSLDKRTPSIKAKEKGKETEWTPPSTTPLPQEIVPMANTATQAAIPYLKGETLALFYQMVGTLYVAAQASGMTQMEVVLNAPSYSQSKFYGASIIIEKYASAPASFNIRLTGSNEAVSLFQKNIPNFMEAFQKGNFSFEIGRMEAEYKPLFHRKEKSGSKQDFGNASSNDQEG